LPDIVLGKGGGRKTEEHTGTKGFDAENNWGGRTQLNYFTAKKGVYGVSCKLTENVQPHNRANRGNLELRKNAAIHQTGGGSRNAA